MQYTDDPCESALKLYIFQNIELAVSEIQNLKIKFVNQMKTAVGSFTLENTSRSKGYNFPMTNT